MVLANCGYCTAGQHYPGDAAVDDVVEGLNRDGGVIVHDMLPGDAVEQIIADLAPTYDETAPGSKSGSARGPRSAR